LVYDGLVKAEAPENAFLTAPDAEFGPMDPLLRESHLRKMSVLVSVESAKAVAKALKEKAAGAAGVAAAKP
jgi:hypothetical protein